MSFSCTDKDTLVAYVYDECDAATRAAVGAHLAACPACADEVGGFGRVREALSQWAPPERAGGFRIVRDEEAAPQAPARPLRPARWWLAPAPALARLAAGILLFAGGAALANLDVRYDKDAFVVRTGWRQAAPAPAAAVAGRTAAPVAAPLAQPSPAAAQNEAPAPAPWRVDMVSLERQLRDEFRQQLASARAANAGAGLAQASLDSAAENRMMTRVRALLDDGLRRQQFETALRISQVERTFQAQRRADMVKVQQTFDLLDGGLPTLQQQSKPEYIRLFPVNLKK